MFLEQLTSPQQDAFLQLASRLISVDGDIHPFEEEMLTSLARKTADNLPTEELPISALVLEFDTRASRAAVLLELLGLAHADAVYGPEEQDFISDLARRMGVSQARLAAMESWVIRQLALAAEGQAFLEEG